MRAAGRVDARVATGAPRSWAGPVRSLAGLTLESGLTLSPVEVAYEAYGELSAAGDNAVLVCHALTGDARVAGGGPGDTSPGWWDHMVGPGRPLDTSRFLVICSNVLGGCSGTTGPASTNPATGRPYAMDFPQVSVRDMVRLQCQLVRSLGVRRLVAVVGGSLGGMQALEWALMYPDMVGSTISIAACGQLSARAIAYNQVQRLAITRDPGWNHGQYYGTPGPRGGLALARMIGTITYKSDLSWDERFGRARRDGELDAALHRDGCFEIEGFLLHQGHKLLDRFDANSYLYLTRAMDLHDIAAGRGDYQGVLERIKCPVLVVSISSDMIFPTYQQRWLVQALRRAGRQVHYAEIESERGHDAFLVPDPVLETRIEQFILTTAGVGT